MNLKEAKRLKPGAIVRESFYPRAALASVHGIVIGKKYVKERHEAKILGGYKDERYDIVIHWTCKEPAIPRPGGSYRAKPERLQLRQNWELMVVSHG
jgi:hypothetical protein